MNFTRNDQLAEELLRKIAKSQQGEDRTFQHPSVTDLIQCLTKSFYNMQEPVEESAQTNLYYLIGLGVEKALIGGLQHTKANGEFEGVFYHLDSLDAGSAEGGWFELKTTRISPDATKNNPLSGIERYLAPGHGFGLNQILAYAKTQNLRELDFGIVYLIQAKFEVWRVSFTQEEIDTHWEWMQIRKGVFNKAMEDNWPPEQYQWNQDWECKNCSYVLRCELKQRLEDREKVNSGS